MSREIARQSDCSPWPTEHLRLPALRAIAWVAPVLVIAGFAVPGLVGGLLFRAWTLTLVAWLVLVAHELDDGPRRV